MQTEPNEAKPNLPAFHIFCDNGIQWKTSMARGITLEDARKYFMRQKFEMAFGGVVIDVKQLPDCPQGPNEEISCYDTAERRDAYGRTL